MKRISLLAAVAAGLLSLTAMSARAEQDGVAIAIVYDTSGSMKDSVRDKAQSSGPKYVIANRALLRIARQIQTYASGGKSTPRTVLAGLFVFHAGNAREAIKFGPFDVATFEEFARKFVRPEGNTPLGNALSAAWERVLNSGMKHKHVLVITDGVNTAGPRPEAVLPKLKQRAEQKQTYVGVHFVAFDVDARVFDPLKRLDATVVGAADEVELHSRLQQILQEKILLEDEEPKK